MSLTLARWRMAVAAGAVVVMTACTALPPAERSVPDRFADAYIELLPVAALMDHAAKQDPSWPLGAKAALVSEAQLGCMRRALLPTEVESAQRKTARDYAQALRPARLSLAGSGQATGDLIEPIEIVRRSDQGEAFATACLDRYVNRLARGLASVINVLDPDAIVLGGGLSRIPRLYRDVPAQWERYVFSDHVTTELLAPKFGDASGVRGAAWLWPETPS